MYKRVVAGLVVVIALAGSVAAQKKRTPPPRKEPQWQFFVKSNFQSYDNFFQAAEGTPQADVTALLAEAGASVGLSDRTPLRLYGSVNRLHYLDEGLDASNGIRIGLRSNGKPHAFDVYAETLTNRPTFEVGDEFAAADIRTLAGEYSYRFLEDWQVSADGELQQQEFDTAANRDNDFHSLGGAVRWRGSRLFSPEIGLRYGQRDVDDPALSYDQRDLYVQIRSQPAPEIYLSLRYRDRSRDYSTNNPLAGNFNREDARHQIAATADWTFMPSWTLNLYASRENVDVNQAGRDFDTSLYLAGVTWHF